MGFAGVWLLWTAEVREFGGVDSGETDVDLFSINQEEDWEDDIWGGGLPFYPSDPSWTSEPSSRVTIPIPPVSHREYGTF